MRTLIVALFLFVIALPSFATERRTVEQIERLLASAHSKPNAKLERQLFDLELTERASSVRLAHWVSGLTDGKARQALIALADASAFLELPAAEIPPLPPPEPAEQRQIMTLATNYIGKTLSQLPNFFATRETTRFADMPPDSSREPFIFPFNSRSPVTTPASANFSQPMHQLSKSTVTVLYRDGNESVETASSKKLRVAIDELSTQGEFGPILTTVMTDTDTNGWVWNHWEQGTSGNLAVFHFAVFQSASHYVVATYNAPHKTAYHGEIAVNPADGSILRLSLIADLEPGDPVATANVQVEYGPVDIGGRSYICPVKSIAMTQIRVSKADGKEVFQTKLNDVLFRQYHLFRAEVRVLTGDSPKLEEKTPVGDSPGTSATEQVKAP